MLQYGDYWEIANDVLAKLNLPEAITSEEESKALMDEYLRDDSVIANMVEEAMQNYDTSDNHPADIKDIKQNALEAVCEEIEILIEDYERGQAAITTNAYAQIVELLQNANIEGVVDVDVEYEPADPSVGIYGEERNISFKLSNGEYIYFNVEFGD